MVSQMIYSLRIIFSYDCRVDELIGTIFSYLFTSMLMRHFKDLLCKTVGVANKQQMCHENRQK